MHSGLSEGERYDTWRRARQGKISIVVGPRSALFAPFPNLGLIVIDEAHDDSYYQSDIPPHYHAVEVAITLCSLDRFCLSAGLSDAGYRDSLSHRAEATAVPAPPCAHPCSSPGYPGTDETAANAYRGATVALPSS
jgi:hypothetical protein